MSNRRETRGVKVERARQLRRGMTPAERTLWEHLRARRFHGATFRRQHLAAGFILDFYCHAAGLAIELDGDVHEQQKMYDAARTDVLGARGVTVIRFSNDEVLTSLSTVLARIADHLRRLHLISD